jgi:hypothetical protein
LAKRHGVWGWAASFLWKLFYFARKKLQQGHPAGGGKDQQHEDSSKTVKDSHTKKSEQNFGRAYNSNCVPHATRVRI